VAEVRPASWDDLEAVHRLLEARSRAALGTSEIQLDHLRADWALPTFEVGRDNWVAVEDGRVVGYAGLGSAQQFAHAAQDTATGDELLRRVEVRARERELDRILTTVAPGYVRLSELVRRHGFTLDREILRMWKPLDGADPEPEWPNGVSVRTYDSGDGERVQALLADAYRSWDEGYIVRARHDWLRFMTGHDEFDPGVWFLVERGGDLVAAALHWKEHRGDGWVKDIVVREAERGRGLGRALLLQAFAEYRRRGARRVGLKVDSNNPTGAPRLYERVGFVVDRRYKLWAKRL